MAAVGTPPTSRSVQAKTYLDAMKYMAGCANDTIEQCHLQSEGGVLSRACLRRGLRVLPRALDPQRMVRS
ncbi:hypothetical protein ACU686_44055 [Yinghuangia aomiensis]